MTTDFLFQLLAWSLAINYSILFIWFSAFVFARHWLHDLHGRWFHLSDNTFDAIHYSGMAIYKIGILLFNVAPLVALCVIRSSA